MMSTECTDLEIETVSRDSDVTSQEGPGHGPASKGRELWVSI